MAGAFYTGVYRNVFAEYGYSQEFDRLWKWSKTYMYMTEGENAGFFGSILSFAAFFCETEGGKTNGVYLIDGTPVEKDALHPIAIVATNAQASLVSDGKYAEACVRKFWETPLRTGDRRYYDNCLYFFALLALSGKYRIWK